MTYRRLEKDEIIQEGDEIDRCTDDWRDDPVWEPVHLNNIGDHAPDPTYPAHRQYRRPVTEVKPVEPKRDGPDFGMQVKPEDPGDVLTVREKALLHLKTWNKKQLATQLLNSASDGWLGKWADEYDSESS